ncbi:MAG TPA: helix-turn-helix transcriptional regulator [Allocoleopsis sp.]
MRFFEAFQQTLLRFNIKASDLAKTSGVSTAQLSNFRNGRNIRVDNLERILAALPKEARKYLLSLVENDPAAGLAPLPDKNSPEDLEDESDL